MRLRNIHIGKIIPGLTINWKPAPYPVLNERGIRATAGILFLIGISVMRYTILTKDRTLLFIVLPLFWLHFFIVTVRWTRFAPFAILGRLLVSNQTPEYVGAIQKRFARGMGLFMATIMMVLVYVVWAGPLWLLSICGLCLLFMWLESAVGLCIGCKIYYALIKKWRIKEPTHRPACPGGACPIG